MMYLNINVTRKCKFETETNKTKKKTGQMKFFTLDMTTDFTLDINHF